MSVEARPAAVALHRRLAAEEAARADFYALLARLLKGGPDGALLASLAAAAPLPADGDPALVRAWQKLVDASSVMDPDAAAEEYEKLFVGVGKAVVPIYAGFYTGAPALDHPRVRIQAHLAALGLARPERLTEPEDHLAGLLDVMRVLAAGGAGRGPGTLEEQRRFFDEYLAPSLPAFFKAVREAAEANYYRRVAEVGSAFTALEAESFLLD